MTKNLNRRPINRRDFLKIAGGALATAAGASLLPGYLRKNVLRPTGVEVASAQFPAPDLYLAGTDGWIYLPPTPNIFLAGSLPGAPSVIHPDDLAPNPFNAYMFGFRNITGMSESQKLGQKMKAQHSAPLFWTQQDVEFRLQLTNLGLAMRPDLIDAHTVHWHGFRNAIPFFDGEPAGSISVPIGRDFTYVYRAHEPGTYMYHCHVEDVEHVHMGMTGLVFVRPAQDGTDIGGFAKFAYNCGDGSTGYDREFAMFLSEFWAESHWADSHVQLPEWTDYKPDFYMLNGRVYPDTLAPNAPINEAASLHYLAVETVDNPGFEDDGDLVAPPGRPDLQYQPHSSLVTCNAGERVLLRFANLGFERQSMSLTGIDMRVVGKDATLLRGRNGEDISYSTNTIPIGAGESYDAIFEAPAHSGTGAYDTYLLYNRNYRSSNNLDGSGYGGQMTEVRVYPAGTLGAQSLPNT